MKITLVVCYKDYVRTRVLTQALQAIEGVDLRVIANKRQDIGRYPEVMFKLVQERFSSGADVYAVTFRGYEMLLWMVLLRFKKPIIFDEFINLTEWLDEHRRIKQGSLGYKLVRKGYGWLVNHARSVLADTPEHAEYSAALNQIPIERYAALPVGTDETVFDVTKPPHKHSGDFSILYYGSMLPLHGLQYLLDAAVTLASHENIRFEIIGGGKQTAASCKTAVTAGARVSYEAWVPFEQLPERMRAAGLNIAGPFGNTLQSQFVITGKTYQFLALELPTLIGINKASDIFVDKHNCLAVPQGDAQAIADSIVWAASHPTELRAIGKEGRALYEQHYSQAIIRHRVEAILKSILP